LCALLRESPVSLAKNHIRKLISAAKCVPEDLNLYKIKLFQNIIGKFQVKLGTKKITNLAEIKIINYKFVTFDI
jgi:hypothetical protein